MDTLKQIEGFLRQHPRSSTRQIATRLHLSTSTVRYHLKTFERRGILRSQTRWISQFGYTREYYLIDDLTP
jgi:predicted ArsR family transcriptional regulator